MSAARAGASRGGNTAAVSTAASADVAPDGSLSVLGQPLQRCPGPHRSGFYRSGFCMTGPDDTGSHVVAAVMTEEFLEFTKARGNDLSTPRPEWGFPGLKPGDGWCLCASRWAEAERAGVAPLVALGSTHANALKTVPLDTLRAHSDGSDASSEPAQGDAASDSPSTA
ncbi:hypothetical protein FNF28_00339 [Cafeteria roenbergensis]|nr:hypothetical protein FNF28_00339 [Cafeteria roenbergensis]